MALIDGSQHFNILQKSQNFKNLKKKLYSFLLFQKLGTLFFMISKNISDLKDIKFEISTALQFEPSRNNIATLLTFKSIISKLLQPLGCHRYEFYSVHEVF